MIQQPPLTSQVTAPDFPPSLRAAAGPMSTVPRRCCSRLAAQPSLAAVAIRARRRPSPQPLPLVLNLQGQLVVGAAADEQPQFAVVATSEAALGREALMRDSLPRSRTVVSSMRVCYTVPFPHLSAMWQVPVPVPVALTASVLCHWHDFRHCWLALLLMMPQAAAGTVVAPAEAESAASAEGPWVELVAVASVHLVDLVAVQAE